MRYPRAFLFATAFYVTSAPAIAGISEYKYTHDLVLQFMADDTNLTSPQITDLQLLVNLKSDNCAPALNGSVVVVIDALMPNFPSPSDSQNAIERGKNIKAMLWQLELTDAQVFDGISTIQEAARRNPEIADIASKRLSEDLVFVSLACNRN